MDAARAEFDRESSDRAGFPADEEPSNAVLNAAYALDEARAVAMKACYGDVPPPWGLGWTCCLEPVGGLTGNVSGSTCPG